MHDMNSSFSRATASKYGSETAASTHLTICSGAKNPRVSRAMALR